MAFLPQGSSAQVAITAGQSIAVGAVRGGTANVTFPVGYAKGPSDTVVNGTETFGPFATATTVTVYAAQGTAEYVTGTNPVCTDGPVALATDPLTGEVYFPYGNGKLRLGGASKLVFWGDSYSMPSATTSTPTSATASGGVVTVTLAAHTFYNGQRLRHYGFADAAANVLSARITRLSANTYSYPAPGVADGTLSSGLGWTIVVADNYAQTKIASNMQRRSGAAFDVSDAVPLSGHTTAQTLLRLADVQSYSPDILAIVEGYNDIAQSVAQETTLANICAKVVAFPGIPVLVSSLSPWNSGASANSLANRQKVLWINKKLEAFCRRVPNALYIDIYSKAVNTATGLAKTGWISTNDNIHPMSIWNDTWATLALTALSSSNYRKRALVASSEDNKATSSTNSNLNPNAPWTASGGTVSGGATGTAATGVTVTREAGTPTTVASVVADSEGVGNAQRVVITPGAANDQVRITFAMTAADFTAGGTLSVKGKINTTNLAASNCFQITGQLIFVDSTGTRTLYDAVSNAGSGEVITADYVDAGIGWDGIAIPNDTMSLARFDVIVKFYAASATPLTLDVSRVSAELS